jgi:hypothetical protein
MRRKHWMGVFVSATVLFGIAGCGTSNPTATTSSSQYQAHGGQRTFQLNMKMTTTPTTPTAGKPFTVAFSIERPNRNPNNGSNNGSYTGNGGHRSSGNWAGGGQGGSPPTQRTMTAQISGTSVNQTLPLASQNGVFEAQTTIQQAGAYKVTVTMDIGQRQIQKQFTLQVNK